MIYVSSDRDMNKEAKHIEKVSYHVSVNADYNEQEHVNITCARTIHTMATYTHFTSPFLCSPHLWENVAFVWKHYTPFLGK